MKKRIVLAAISCLFIFTIYSCLDPYNPPSTTADVNYLVVDGFLNSSDRSCTITLSRTLPISSTEAVKPEGGAKVKLEDENGVIFPLPEKQNGVYGATNLNLNTLKKYKLKITTKAGVEYSSDLVPVLQTPPIDSLTLGNERGGLTINVNTHDPANSTHYYSWKYKETWKYVSAFDSNIKFQGGKVVERPPNEKIYECWQSASSTDVLINSSKSLEEDAIHYFTLTTLPWRSAKVALKYSIFVEQRALSKASYDYQQQLKKNTENLGTLFDALPTRITGNIHCITNPSELAIGYFTAGEVQTKRLFVPRNKIKSPPGTGRPITGYEDCVTDTFDLQTPFSDMPVWYLLSPQGIVIGYVTSVSSCVDCRLLGGTTTKPDFWE